MSSRVAPLSFDGAPDGLRRRQRSQSDADRCETPAPRWRYIPSLLSDAERLVTQGPLIVCPLPPIEG